ncbi:hypothetical protein RO3G_14148 [Rhizopus delemar RA 99-880]|uniref:Uncharacterized protein n=1 Tax=Rhizopus delemar (strain RA 99-880 / ATCC MYA-4621 / FGSC 9543 / NRRL 43880) TaxID=246409 RepID=I1CLV7_RHIO9|nr:hypothetical protein RO3G_14148 [Rhizopus delemar RA 99-880]|eukprot:EIE89437.1 hypothetical protein RO3G_14148 [Rhizopus delemar RA 99-880]
MVPVNLTKISLELQSFGQQRTSKCYLFLVDNFITSCYSGSNYVMAIEDAAQTIKYCNIKANIRRRYFGDDDVYFRFMLLTAVYITKEVSLLRRTSIFRRHLLEFALVKVDL